MCYSFIIQYNYNNDLNVLSLQESYCRTCAELQSVKDQLCDELLIFKSKAEELEIKIEEVHQITSDNKTLFKRKLSAQRGMCMYQSDNFLMVLSKISGVVRRKRNNTLCPFIFLHQN